MFLITGGGSGIGRALAIELAKRNERVMIVGRRNDKLVQTAQLSPGIQTCCADVADVAGQQQVLEALRDKTHLKGVIHNAGIIEPINPLSQINQSDWDKTLATNLNAPLFLSQMLLPKLKQGRVLHIGSGAAYIPIKGWAAYCASKAALSMLTRIWQLEIAVNETAFASVMPGIIDTEMQEKIRSADFMDPDKRTFFESLYADNKLVSPQTVASFITWLLLDISPEHYASQEWDIYDKSHHSEWLKSPQTVPDLEA